MGKVNLRPCANQTLFWIKVIGGARQLLLNESHIEFKEI
jgi:hypothetical protein